MYVVAIDKAKEFGQGHQKAKEKETQTAEAKASSKQAEQGDFEYSNSRKSDDFPSEHINVERKYVT